MYYSLRNKNIQKKKRKSSIFFVIFFLIIAGLFSFLGVKILVNIINTITDIKKSDTNSENKDVIPPKIPYLYPISEYTKYPSVELKGNAEPSSEVILIYKNSEDEIVAGNDGSFTFVIELTEGVNEFYFYSKDLSGNKSSNSKKYSIIFDKSPPTLDIASPQNNSVFYGYKNRIIEIKGASEKDSIITINDKYVFLSDQNNFVYKFELSNGENIIHLKARDPAGNEEVKDLTITFNE